MAATKSRGAGTVILVLVVLLAVAGGSAWFIHGVLSGEDPLAGISGAHVRSGDTASAPAADGADSAATPLPGDAAGGEEAAGNGQAHSGQDIPGQPPGTERTASGMQTLDETVAARAPFADASQASDPGEITGEEPGSTNGAAEENARNFLLVPGAIAEPTPAAREDAVVRPAFINDMAMFLAQNYWPKNTHPSAGRSGITTASLRWANLRYGAELQGLDGRRGDPAIARKAVLGYVLNPATVSRIYDLYAADFVSALTLEADRRTVGEGAARRALTTAEKKEMFAMYAGYAARVSSALDRYAADPGMAGRVKAYAEASRVVEEANRAYMESMMAYEDVAESGNRAEAGAARLRMDKDAATYQKRIREREGMRDALLGAMSRGKGARSGDDTIMYVAFWAYRRGPDSAASLRACAKALGDMSAALTAAARTF